MKISTTFVKAFPVSECLNKSSLSTKKKEFLFCLVANNEQVKPPQGGGGESLSYQNLNQIMNSNFPKKKMTAGKAFPSCHLCHFYIQLHSDTSQSSQVLAKNTIAHTR